MIFESGINENTIENTFSDVHEIEEMLIVDVVSRLPEEKINEFCESGGVGETLVNEGKLRRRTFVRLSKNDDLKRRQKLFAISLGKENNDPLYNKWLKKHEEEKELLHKLYYKYNNKSKKLATQAQKEYLHPASSKKVMPKSFLKAGGDDR